MNKSIFEYDVVLDKKRRALLKFPKDMPIFILKVFQMAL